MGPFMVEIVFCRVTRRGRKKGKGMNKLAKENCRNDGPAFSFIPPEDTIKITLDLSDNGPVFSALDSMMMKMMDDDAKERKGNKANSDEAKKSLKKLMKSGIPGVEKLFTSPQQAGAPGMKKKSKGFHSMNDSSKQKFMTAIFGEDGTSIEAGTAAALLAAMCSGGDPEIGNNIAEMLLPEMGDKVDPAMMAALMSSCSLINIGALTEEVMKVMKAELSNSGLTDEEILRRTQILMKAFGRSDPSATVAEYNLASKQRNSALKRNNTSPKDFTIAVLVMKAIAACGSTPENVAKIIMIENQLSKKGAQSRFIADALKHLGDFEAKRDDVVAAITNAFAEEKLKRDDVFLNVRMTQAIDNENEPTWKEVKNMKDILAGCSPNSPEGIELNLARATKSGGLGKNDIAAVLIAQKTMAALGADAKSLAQIINIQKLVAENGVPAAEIARVLSDGVMPPDLTEFLAQQATEALTKDLTAQDVDYFVNLYDNLRLKSNIPLEVIEHIDNTLIQVRCSLEDVADNLVCSQLARGEKESMVIRALCETLMKTGSSPESVAVTMMAALRRVLTKEECDIMKDIGRTMHEQGTDKTALQKSMVELLMNLLDENPESYELRMNALQTLELVLKETGGFPNEIRDFINTLDLPPEPPDPKVLAEIARKQAEEEAREAERLRKEAEAAEAAERAKNPVVEAIQNNESRRGSLAAAGSRRGSGSSVTLGGVERRGSFYSADITEKATVAMVVDNGQIDGTKTFFDEEDVQNGVGIDHPIYAQPGAGGSISNQQQLYNGRAQSDVLASILSGIMDEGDMGPDLDATLKAIRSGKVTDEDVNKLMSVFVTSGVVSSAGGVTRLRKISDIRNTLLATDRSFEEAIQDAQNREFTQVSAENGQLLDDILQRSADNQHELSDRVKDLMANSASKGVRIQRRDRGGDQVDFTSAGDELGQPNQRYKPRRKAQSEMHSGPVPLHQASSEELESRAAAAGIRIQRRSVKRTSLARLARKTSEFSGLRHPQGMANGSAIEDDFFDDGTDHRKIIGLKRSKVPMMVYSHGGFSRCFRIARRYHVDGPPVGVEYEEVVEDTRSGLNPELQNA